MDRPLAIKTSLPFNANHDDGYWRGIAESAIRNGLIATAAPPKKGRGRPKGRKSGRPMRRITEQ